MSPKISEHFLFLIIFFGFFFFVILNFYSAPSELIMIFLSPFHRALPHANLSRPFRAFYTSGNALGFELPSKKLNAEGAG